MRYPYVVGGIGEKKSNKVGQYYQQDSVYLMGDIAMCLPANLPTGSYMYLIREDGKKADYVRQCE